MGRLGIKWFFKDFFANEDEDGDGDDDRDDHEDLEDDCLRRLNEWGF